MIKTYADEAKSKEKEEKKEFSRKCFNEVLRVLKSKASVPKPIKRAMNVYEALPNFF